MQDHSLPPSPQQSFQSELAQALQTIQELRETNGKLLESLAASSRKMDRLELLGKSLENFPEIVAILSPSHDFIFINQAFVRAYGYSSEQVLGQHISLLFSPAAPASETVPAMLPFRENTWEGELVTRTKDGTDFNGILRTSPIRDDGGKLLGRIIVIERGLQQEAAASHAETSDQLLFENNPEAMWVYDLDTLAFLEVNAAAVARYGYSRSEFLGMTIKDIRPPEDVPALLENLANPVLGLERSGVWRHRKKGGPVIDVQIVSHPLTLRGRRAKLVVATDITERLAAERTLMEREARHRTLLDTLSDGFWVNDLRGHILEVNDTYLRRSGYSRDELLSMRVADLEAVEKPEDTSAHIDLLVHQGHDRFETRHRSKDGRIWDVEVSLVYLPFEGGRICASLHDISRRKRAEENLRLSDERFRALFELAPDGIYLMDSDGVFVDGNKAAEDLVGYPRSEFIGKSFRSLNLLGSPDLLVALTALLHLAEGHSPGPREYMLRRKDGRMVPVEIRAFPIALQGAKLILGVARDITERKQSERILGTFHSLAARLGETRTAADVGRSIVAVADDLWHWDAAVFDICSPAQDSIETVLNVDVVEGKRQELPAPGIPVPITPLVRLTLRDGPQLICRQGPPSADSAFAMFGDVTRFSASIMSVPVRSHGRAVGMLGLHSYTPNAFTKDDLETLQGLADHCGGALDRIDAEAASREAEERLRLIVQSINEVFWLADAEIRTMLYVSPAYERVWGRPCESLYADPRSFLAAIHEEDRGRVESRLVGTKSGETFDLRYRIVRPDGTVRWIWDRGFPVRTTSLGATQYAGVATDITEQVQAERALREASQFNEQIIASAQEGIIVYAPDLTCRVWNRYMEQATELHAAQALGKPILEIFPFLNQTPFREACTRTLNGGGSTTLEVEYTMPPTGRKGWALHTSGPLRDAQGTIIGIIALVRDITERRRAEEELRKLSLAVDQSGASIVITDAANTIEYVNPKFVEQSGYSAEEVSGRNPRILQSGLTPAETYKELWGALRSGREWHGEFQNRKKSGEVFLERAHISPIRDASGTITHSGYAHYSCEFLPLVRAFSSVPMTGPKSIAWLIKR